jgi:hypothetical protein
VKLGNVLHSSYHISTLAKEIFLRACETCKKIMIKLIIKLNTNSDFNVSVQYKVGGFSVGT